eukprot:339670_1
MRAGFPPAPRAFPITTASTAWAGKPLCCSSDSSSGRPSSWGLSRARAEPIGATGLRAQAMMGVLLGMGLNSATAAMRGAGQGICPHRQALSSGRAGP